MRATQCKKILMPETPDDVLVSCGVVVLHCIPKKENSVVRLVSELAIYEPREGRHLANVSIYSSTYWIVLSSYKIRALEDWNLSYRLQIFL